MAEGTGAAAAGAGAAGIAGAGAAAGAAAGAGGAPWYQGVAGVDEAMVGHWRNQGWDGKSPQEVAALATKSWKEAEKYIGAPAAQMLRLPKDAADEKGWDGVYQRLGKPADPNGYDFASVKWSDGTPLEEAFVGSMRAAAHRLHLSKDQAAGIAAEVTKYLESADSAEAADRTAKLEAQKAALKKNWGPNEAANMFLAQRAANALGVAKEDVSALEQVIGYDKVMEMFRQIGTKIGEDKFIEGTGAGGGKTGVMTREEAIAKRADLMRDEQWRGRYLKGGVAEAREMTALNVIITGDTTSPTVRAA